MEGTQGLDQLLRVGAQLRADVLVFPALRRGQQGHGRKAVGGPCRLYGDGRRALCADRLTHDAERIAHIRRFLRRGGEVARRALAERVADVDTARLGRVGGVADGGRRSRRSGIDEDGFEVDPSRRIVKRARLCGHGGFRVADRDAARLGQVGGRYLGRLLGVGGRVHAEQRVGRLDRIGPAHGETAHGIVHAADVKRRRSVLPFRRLCVDGERFRRHEILGLLAGLVVKFALALPGRLGGGAALAAHLHGIAEIDPQLLRGQAEQEQPERAKHRRRQDDARRRGEGAVHADADDAAERTAAEAVRAVVIQRDNAGSTVRRADRNRNQLDQRTEEQRDHEGEDAFHDVRALGDPAPPVDREVDEQERQRVDAGAEQPEQHLFQPVADRAAVRHDEAYRGQNCAYYENVGQDAVQERVLVAHGARCGRRLLRRISRIFLRRVGRFARCRRFRRLRTLCRAVFTFSHVVYPFRFCADFHKVGTRLRRIPCMASPLGEAVNEVD